MVFSQKNFAKKVVSKIRKERKKEREQETVISGWTDISGPGLTSFFEYQRKLKRKRAIKKDGKNFP